MEVGVAMGAGGGIDEEGGGRFGHRSGSVAGRVDAGPDKGRHPGGGGQKGTSIGSSTRPEGAAWRARTA